LEGSQAAKKEGVGKFLDDTLRNTRLEHKEGMKDHADAKKTKRRKEKSKGYGIPATGEDCEKNISENGRSILRNHVAFLVRQQETEIPDEENFAGPKSSKGRMVEKKGGSSSNATWKRKRNYTEV